MRFAPSLGIDEGKPAHRGFQRPKESIMSSTVTDKAAEAGHKIAETAKTVGSKIVEGTEKAAEWVKEKTQHKSACDTAKMADQTTIREHMDVIASCGKKVGSVDRVEEESIKLTKKDSPDNQHHLIPKTWIARVDEHVHLNKNSEEVAQAFLEDTVGCCA
jgi:hypothetical protein